MQGRGTACHLIRLTMSSWAPAFFLLFMIGGLVGGVHAAQYVVGGSAGWTLPSIGNVNYSTWAASQTFVMGDTLYFNYSTQYHNLMVVTKADYAACDASRPISTYDDGATVVKLDRSGTFYFLCGVPSHCTDGQKLEAKVRKHALSISPSPPSTSQDNYIIPPSPFASFSPSSSPLAGTSNAKRLTSLESCSLTSMLVVIIYTCYLAGLLNFASEYLDCI